MGIRRKRIAVTKAPPPPSMLPAAQGQRVRVWLDAAGLKAKWLGEQIGQSEPQVSKMLNGETKGGIHPVEAWRIARATGLTTMYILYGNREGLSPEALKLLPPED
jgi:hypothetical protein